MKVASLIDDEVHELAAHEDRTLLLDTRVGKRLQGVANRRSFEEGGLPKNDVGVRESMRTKIDFEYMTKQPQRSSHPQLAALFPYDGGIQSP